MKYRLEILVLLLLASYINYLDRVSISFSILELESGFQITDQQFGFIFSAFGIGYLLMMFFNGMIIDRFGSIRVWAVSSIFWGIFMGLTGFAQNFTELLIVRFFLGMAEAFHFPALIKTIADWMDPKLRVRSIAIGILGIPIALIFGGPFITSLIRLFGFREMFMIIGGLGVLWGFAWIYCFLSKENPEYNKKGLLHDTKKEIPWKSFFSSGYFIANCFIVFALTCIYFFIVSWLPGYLEKVYNVSLNDLGLLTAIPWTVAALFSIILGILSDSVYKESGSLRLSRTYPIVFASLIVSACFFLVSFMPGLELDLTFLSIGLGFTFAMLPMIHATNADLFKVHVATAEAIMMCFIAIAAILSPAIAGIFIDKTGNFQAAMLLSSLLALASAILAFIFQRRKKNS